ncbi:enterochelin esterase family protein [Chitinivorax tropicus]|uniref:Enterochelin esterase family protein n=1 Tax=Chitinivorax tropicus TaxID=714531 RepID=A0A840MH05_9PROT|nr:alpha/beta hydrolase-fold protein [Chitinivorax tropicus]MBB5017928.1 enterochelin esterase family protein [Chitinivorax tropicus]
MNPSLIGLQSVLKTQLELAGGLHAVTFQLHAPQACEVLLIGEMTDWQAHPIPMVRDALGNWATTLNLRAGQWIYKFWVDGQYLHDPNNPLMASDGWGGFHSYLLLGDGDWADHDVPHGELIKLTMQSNVLGQQAEVTLYLPPAYQPSQAYPLLYLMHGHRTRGNQWPSNGLIQHFMDNLLAQQVISPFVIAMPTVDGALPLDTLESFLVDELYERLTRWFAIRPGPSNTAIAGMTPHALGAFNLAWHRPDRFGFVAPVSAFFLDETLAALATHPFTTTFGIKLYCGTEDYVYPLNERFAQILKQNQISFDYMRVAGGHTWRYWNSITRDLLQTISGFYLQSTSPLTDPHA